jgi:hypothetical protein
MNEEFHDSNGNNETPACPVKGRGFVSPKFQLWLTFGVLGFVIFYNTGELLRTPEVVEVETNQSMFSIPAEMSDRYNSCNYKYLFFCEAKSTFILPECEKLSGLARSTCILTASGKKSIWASIPYVNVVIGAVELLPRLPDAVIHMLGKRRGRGSLEFSLAVLFVVAYITTLVVALRQQSPSNLYLFAFMLIVGPYLVLGVFWLFQYALAEASLGANKAAAALLTTFGLPGCLLICIRHDLRSLAKVAEEIHRGAGL